ncbi:MAG: Ig-like domain-containing protein [Candidatus ainarchaeum sp.]|nr:Ig-like domain-containing protein [Candidatus ainarchaeum sp.]
MNKNSVGRSKLKNLFLSFFVLFFVVLCAGFVSAAITSITVTDPDGGEYWSGDRNITWTAVGCATDLNVNIYWQDVSLGNSTQIAVDVNCELQYYQWDTTSVANDTDYKIKIRASADSETYDISNAVFIIDNTVPTLTPVTIASGDSNTSSAKVGSTITLSFTASETLSVLPTVTIATHSVVATNTGGLNYTATYAMVTGDSTGLVPFTIDFNDLAGNDGVQVAATTNSSYVIFDKTAPTVSDVNSTNTDNNYKVGDDINITVEFSEAVIVTGTPLIFLELGATDRNATYESGTGTTTLTFTYTVQAGDTSADLDYNGTGALILNSGTIADAAGNTATLTLAAPGAEGSLAHGKAIVIDTTAPIISGVYSNATAAGVLKIGDTIIFTVEIDVDENGLTILPAGYNGHAFVPSWASDDGNSYTATYTVVAGDDLVTALQLTDVNAEDATGNISADVNGSDVAKTIDATYPTVSDVNSTKDDGSYKAGVDINITVGFSEAVTVTGAPLLVLELGATDRNAIYASGSGTTTLTFTYTVEAGDTSSDLDYNATDGLDLNSGTIKDAAGNAATLTLAAPGAAGSLADGKAIVIDTTAPTVSDVNSTNTDNNYKVGDDINITVEFTEAVIVTGTPLIYLELGATDRNASYVSGSGTTTLTFTYTVQTGDTSADLDYNGTGALILNSGTINDAALNNATLTLATPGDVGSLAHGKAIVIDTTAPIISGVYSNATAAGVLKIGDTIIFTVEIDVDENGLTILPAGYNGHAFVPSWASDDGNSYTATYTVVAGDDLVTALQLTDVNAEDATGNISADVNGSDVAKTIDATYPTVSDVNSTKDDGSYKAGVDINITVGFSEAVTVTGAPLLVLELGATDRNAIYASGSGTTTLTFTYTVEAGDTSSDLDYNATDGLDLNSGTIKDAAGNAATLTLAAPGAAGSLADGKAIVIDTTAPTVSNVTSTKDNGTYKAGTDLNITVTFTQAVTVTGTPILTLNTGDINRNAQYLTGSGTTTLTFTYTVQAGDTSLDLDYNGTDALDLNSGTITDAALNNATLTLATPGAAGSLGANKALVIDTTAPIISSVTSNATEAGVLKIGDTIIFTADISVTEAGLTLLPTTYNGQVIAWGTVNGGDTYTATYTVIAGDDTAVAIQLTDVNATDAVGNISANVSGSDVAKTIDATRPTVLDVNSTKADGYYKAGVDINITVGFSEDVNITGAPLIVLELGATDRNAIYVDGNGTDTLTFTYTVQAGDTSLDLDYNATDGLDLNGGTITDSTAGNAATLTLAAPGAAGSLANGKAIVIDTTAPTVTGVTPVTLADASVGTVDVNITFSETMDEATLGTMTVEGLNDSPITITNSSWANSSTIWQGTFTFTDDNEVVTDAFYGILGAKDLAGNVMSTLSTRGENNDLNADTNNPTVAITMSDYALKAGETATVTFTFSEAPTGFAVGDINSPSGAISGLSGTTVYTATFTPTVSTTDATNVITVGTDWTDAAGNAPGVSTTSSNYAVDTLLPTVSSATADSDPATAGVITITVIFSETIDTGTSPTVRVTGLATNPYSVTETDFNSTTWTGTFTLLNNDENATATITVSGAKDVAGNTMTANNSAGTFTADTIAPVVSSVSFDKATYRITPDVNVTVTVVEDTTAATITVNGSGATEGVNGTWTYTFAHGKAVVGTYSLLITATDAAGNSKQSLAYYNVSAADTTGDYNYTQSLNVNWNTLWLPPNISALNDSNTSVAGVVGYKSGDHGYDNHWESGGALWTILYHYDSDSAEWLVQYQGGESEGTGTLTDMNSDLQSPYWIYLSSADRFQLDN